MEEDYTRVLCCTLLYLDDINKARDKGGLDLMLLKEYFDALSKLEDYAVSLNEIVFDNTNTLIDYRYIQNLKKSLQPAIEFIVFNLNNIKENKMIFNGEEYPHSFVCADERAKELCELTDRQVELYTYIIEASSFYHEYVNKNIQLIENSLETLKTLFDTIEKLQEKFADLVEEEYYNFLDNEEAEIEGQLFDLLYSKKIIEDASANPNKKAWGILLTEKLTELNLSKHGVLIKEIYTHRKALDINDQRVISYIFQNCIDDNELELFFHYFAEIAILQEKTRSDIEMIRRPEPEEELVELPSMVVESIRRNRYLSRLFKIAICGLAPRTGKTGFKTKWSHVKTTLEHNKLITEVNPSEFGRQIHDICPDVDADNCRQNIGTNTLNIPNNTKYFELPEINQIRIQCSKVAEEFKEIIEELQRQ